MSRGSAPRPTLPAGHPVHAIAEAVAARGGRARIVGGWVRDQLLGREGAARDVDVEVEGLAPEQLEAALRAFGHVRRVGRAFPIYLVAGLPIDISLPRTSDPGPDGSPPGFDPQLDFAAASRGRDLRINAMGFDPLSGELLDPQNGQADLEAGVLHAVDDETLLRDPLRALRVARLAATLEMQVASELLAACSQAKLEVVAAERVFGELSRLLLEAPAPAVGFSLLEEMELLRFLPELDALRGVEQDAQWHPEGDVWVHTLMCLDAAAALRQGAAERDALLMWAVLCHDLGKPGTTERRDDRVISHGHDTAGVEPASELLGRLRAPNALVRGVSALVRHHLAPALFVRGESGDAGPRGYRRLLRRLREAGCDADLLWRVARADHLGRTTDEAKAGVFPAGDVFLERARAVEREPGTYEAAVTGRMLIARGEAPGPGLGELLERCRQIQDETGWTDPDAILERARSST